MSASGDTNPNPSGTTVGPNASPGDEKSLLDRFGKTAIELLKDPRAYVLGILVQWLVGGLVNLVASIVGLLNEAYYQAAQAPRLLLQGVSLATKPLGGLILGGLNTLSGVVASIIGSFGPLGPLAAILFAAATIVLVRAALSWLLSYLGLGAIAGWL
ncbi:hypothetical protein VB773_14225 [Haloarculaceae archaeon H-GB2-1]|nr:hypothetical protein [Haloarculaceae archaeon H-GB1-1]MEA5408612.1 hypothetical protein [Haloarculaceae archaeon H-GB2-1]